MNELLLIQIIQSNDASVEELFTTAKTPRRDKLKVREECQIDFLEGSESMYVRQKNFLRI